MFAWQIYLFMTNSCDVKWKTIMGFLGTHSLLLSGLFRADINHPVWKKSPGMENCLNLMMPPDVFKKNYWKLSRVDHRSIFHVGTCCWCLRMSFILAPFQICKWTRERLKSAEESNLYVTVLLLSWCWDAGLMIIFHASSLSRPSRRFTMKCIILICFRRFLFLIHHMEICPGKQIKTTWLTLKCRNGAGKSEFFVCLWWSLLTLLTCPFKCRPSRWFTTIIIVTQQKRIFSSQGFFDFVFLDEINQIYLNARNNDTDENISRDGNLCLFFHPTG